MALNQPLNDGYYVLEASTLKASQTVPYGTIAAQVSGKIQPAATGVSGAVLLGMSLQNLAETTGSDATITPAAAFARGCVIEMSGKSGDLPTAAELGKAVYIDTASSVKKTAATDDLEVTLVGIRGSVFMVRLP